MAGSWGPLVGVCRASWAAFQKCGIVCSVHTETGWNHSGSTFPDPQCRATDRSCPDSSTVNTVYAVGPGLLLIVLRKLHYLREKAEEGRHVILRARYPRPVWNMRKARGKGFWLAPDCCMEGAGRRKLLVASMTCRTKSHCAALLRGFGEKSLLARSYCLRTRASVGFCAGGPPRAWEALC